MKIIKNSYVINNDIYRILKGNNNLKFNYMKNKIIIPNEDFLKKIRNSLENDLKKIFNNVEIITEDEMIFNERINKVIVSLDNIYLNKKIGNKVIFLDCTRLQKSDGSIDLVSRKYPNNPYYVLKQIDVISNILKDNNQNEIYLMDDVIFSGEVIKKIVNLFNLKDIKVIGIISPITTKETKDNLKYFDIKTKYILENPIDEICERDFYFGIVGSGVSKKINNRVIKAPYFKPYGEPDIRASIPKNKIEEFSYSCLERSIILWEQINKLSNREIMINELPERINNVNNNESIVKILKGGMKSVTNRNNG